MKFINELICKFKGHDLKHTGTQQVSSVLVVHFLKCDRCGLETFEKKGVNE